MFKWLADIKEGDKVSLLLLYTGILVLIVGVAGTCVMVFMVHNETILDKVIGIVATLTAQGSGLVTAAMGFLRLQPKTPDSSAPKDTGTTDAK